MCNLAHLTIVKRPASILRNLVAALCVMAIGQSAAYASSAMASAEEAARMIARGNPRGAAVTVRLALNTEPGNRLLRQEAAALLLLTGDVEAAAAAWKGLAAEDPSDPLPAYSLGVIALRKGDRAKAQQYFREAARNGDRAACLIAERYLEILTGASGAGLGMVLPDAYIGSAKGMSGLAAAQTGDARRAVTEIGDALSLLPGDPYYETPGLVMTFDAALPIRFGYAPLPQGHGLAARRTRVGERPYSGTLRLAPDDPGAEAGFVVFQIDGALASMVNTRPFQLAWDTTKVPNGPHRVEIVVYDRQGTVIDRAEKEIRTANAEAPHRNPGDSAAAASVRAALWQALALQPSRHALAYAAAGAAEKLGDRKSAIGYWQLAAALDPDYRDTRARLIGVLPAEQIPAVWRADTDAPVVALTFDDGPKPGISERLVDLLVRERVPATFFVIGRHVAAYPELLKKISNAGFQIENHTYTHPNMTMLTARSVEAELLKTVAAVYSLTGRTMRYYRPPGGNTNPGVARAAAKWGFVPCMWTLDADALENGPPEKLVEYVVQRATPGSIVLLHNGRQTTLDAMPRIIAGLRQRGFRFDTIDGLLGRTKISGRVVPGRG